MGKIIDLKNRKLLYELDCNSRMPASKIAKKIGLSKASVIYRMQQLEKDGIIEGYVSYMDYGKLGYLVLRLMLNLHNASPSKEDEMINYIKNQPIVKSLYFMEGKYNIYLTLVTKEMSNIDLFWKKFTEKYLNYFDERSLGIILDQKYYTKSFLIDKQYNDICIDQLSAPKIIDHDDVDVKILNALATNSRISLLELAKISDITVKTAIKRLKILEKNKIISRYGVLLNTEKLGEQRYRMHCILMHINDSKANEFNQFCKNHPNIILEDVSLGGDDFEMEIQVNNDFKLREIVREFKTKFSDIMHDYQIFHILKTYKDESPKIA